MNKKDPQLVISESVRRSLEHAKRAYEQSPPGEIKDDYKARIERIEILIDAYEKIKDEKVRIAITDAIIKEFTGQ